MKIVFDIETTGLDNTAPGSKIHCICTANLTTGERQTFVGDDIQRGVNYLLKADMLIGHYIIFFDIPWIEKLYNVKFNSFLYDTKVNSQLLFPLLKGNHLSDWGERLGLSKKTDFEYTDFSVCTPEMIQQCERDVEITVRLYEKHSTIQGYDKAIIMEEKVGRIIQKQIERGIRFDEQKAIELEAELRQIRFDAINKIREIIPTYLKRATKPRSLIDGRKFHQIWIVPFNPGSDKQIIHWLTTHYKWKPVKFTDKGQARVDYDTLEKLDYPGIKELLKYKKVDKVLGMLSEGNNAWQKLVKNGRIHGRVNTVGTVTGRMTHSDPNMTTMPALYSDYGKECRELFKPSDGLVLVGADASGIEARILAHYIFPVDNGETVKRVLTGDFHSENAKLLFSTQSVTKEERQIAKNSFFAYLYHAQAWKLGEVTGKGEVFGQWLLTKFNQYFPQLKLFTKLVQDKAKKGFLIGLDGRRIPIRYDNNGRPKDEVNYLIQSGGALVMKQALIEAGDLKFVLNVHDDIQVECKLEEAEDVGKRLVEAIKTAGKVLELRCPLDGEYKIGNSLAESH